MIIHQDNTLTKLILISLILLSIFSCQQKTTNIKKPVEIFDLNLSSQLEQDKMINRAITMLQSGNIKQSKLLISQVLNANNQHSTALLLQKQLTLTINELFKTKRITFYSVKSGDSLGGIAKTWLGNPLYFVSLALLNNIKNPTKIYTGLKIQIPVMDNSPIAKKEQLRSESNLKLITQLISDKNYLLSLSKMTNLFILKKHSPQLVKLQKKALHKLKTGLNTLKQKKQTINQLTSILKQSQKFNLNNTLKAFIQSEKHAVLIDESIIFLNKKEYQLSAKKLIEANNIRLKNKSIKTTLGLEVSLINKLHENAITLRRKQLLQKALKNWLLILDIQPLNLLAKKYSQRTIQLLEKLKQIN